MSEPEPQIAQSSPHSKVRTVLFIVSLPLWGFAVNLALQKGWVDNVPDWLVGLLFVIPILIWIYYAWTHQWVKERRRLVYTYPRMSFVVLVTVGALVGSAFGAFAWWTTHRQREAQTPSSTAPPITAAPTPEEVEPPEVKADEPKPNLLPVSYGKLHILYDHVTHAFKEADSGILVLVARFRNSHERGKVISEAKEIRARIIFEPSEFYEKLNKGVKDAEKSTPGFANVHEGIWLNEKDSVVNFARGETKTLIVAVQIPDLGFGAFDAFEHSMTTRSGQEVYLPKVPKVTADKYVVKVVLEGGERGDIDELFHFTVTLRPEFNISYP